jgi:ABC-type multidrug transport system fused ATPase/permease subunit
MTAGPEQLADQLCAPDVHQTCVSGLIHAGRLEMYMQPLAHALLACCCCRGWPGAGAIEFQDVWCRYRPGLPPVLSRLSFVVEVVFPSIFLQSDTGRRPTLLVCLHSSCSMSAAELDCAARDRTATSTVSPGVMPAGVMLQGGSSCGVVGRTGSGKSSLMLALFRLVDITRGRVLIDGTDVSTIGLDALRSQLAIIPQVGLWFVFV